VSCRAILNPISGGFCHSNAERGPEPNDGTAPDDGTQRLTRAQRLTTAQSLTRAPVADDGTRA
jgi:hypothetical protein